MLSVKLGYVFWAPALSLHQKLQLEGICISSSISCNPLRVLLLFVGRAAKSHFVLDDTHLIILIVTK